VTAAAAMGKASSKKDLSPGELGELVARTGLTSDEIADWYEKFRHEFPAGHIDRRQFRSVYGRLCRRWLDDDDDEATAAAAADRLWERVFDVYDSDGDGVVSFVELLTTLHVFADGRSAAADKLRAMFRMYDVDHDGFVTCDEIANILAVRDV